MICARCQTPAGPQQRFCRSCGSSLQAPAPAPAPERDAGIACPSCGHDNTPGHRFCRACGTASSLSGELARPSRVMALPTDDEQTIAQRDAAVLPAAGPPPAPDAPAGAPPDSQALTTPVAALGPPCQMCGAPAAGRRFCGDCDPLAVPRERASPPLAGAPVKRRRAAPAPPVAAAPAPPAPPVAAAPAPPAAPARRRMSPAVVAVVIVLLVAGAAAGIVLAELVK